MGDNNRVSILAYGRTVHMESDAAERQIRIDQFQHLQTLVNRADYSDVEFLCRDGDTVKASKLLLIGRSPVFDMMLTNGMLESSQSVIKLPEISSAVLLYILEILYVGTSVNYPLNSWTMGLEAISAAHFLLLPSITKIVQKFLWAEVAKLAGECYEDLSKASTEASYMLTTAMSFKCIVHDEDIVVLELVRLLDSRWMEVDCVMNLSEEALDYILRHTMPNPETELSLEEYFRLRGVVLWCVCQDIESASQKMKLKREKCQDIDSAREKKKLKREKCQDIDSAIEKKKLKREELVNFSLPFSKDHLYDVRSKRFDVLDMAVIWLPKRDEVSRKVEQLRDLLSQKRCKDSIARLFRHINLRHIPGPLLVKTIGFLQILPPSQYTEILEILVIRGSVRFSLDWDHNFSYATRTRGSVIFKRETGHGCAICQVAATKSDEILQWRFCVETVGPDGIQLGLAFGDSESWSDSVDDGMLSDEAGSATMCLVRIDFAHWLSAHSNMHDHGLPDFAFSFTCNLTTRLCYVTGKESGQILHAQSTLPAGDIFPAVYLGHSEGARVRTELISGFDIF